jgi:hypothetical protein
MAVCKSVTIPGMTGHVRRNTQWKRIKGFNLLTLVVNNVKFKDGEQVQDQSDRSVA